MLEVPEPAEKRRKTQDGSLSQQSPNIMCSTGFDTEIDTKRPVTVRKFMDSENEESAPKKRHTKAVRKNESFKEPRRSTRAVAR